MATYNFPMSKGVRLARAVLIGAIGLLRPHRPRAADGGGCGAYARRVHPGH